jgi:hypothetical protein
MDSHWEEKWVLKKESVRMDYRKALWMGILMVSMKLGH